MPLSYTYGETYSYSNSAVNYFDIPIVGQGYYQPPQYNTSWTIKALPVNSSAYFYMQRINSSGTARQQAYSGWYTYATTLSRSYSTGSNTWSTTYPVTSSYNSMKGIMCILNFTHGPDSDDINMPSAKLQVNYMYNTYCVSEYISFQNYFNETLEDFDALRFYFSSTSSAGVAKYQVLNGV